MNQSDLKQDIDINLKALMRDLIQEQYFEAYKSYKALFQIGSSVLPSLKAMVLDTDWSNIKRKGISRYFAGLICLIRDIDESEANSIAENLESKGLPNYLQAELKSICSFSLKNYNNYKMRGIDLYTHKDIKTKFQIPKYIEKWLRNIPDNDLSEINRIYIVRPDDVEASGTYMPMLFNIALKWNDDDFFKDEFILKILFFFKIFLLLNESTFYHEIGHHVHRHKFGRDPKQEEEANIYKRKIMKKVHPFFDLIFGFFKKINHN